MSPRNRVSREVDLEQRDLYSASQVLLSSGRDLSLPFTKSEPFFLESDQQTSAKSKNVIVWQHRLRHISCGRTLQIRWSREKFRRSISCRLRSRLAMLPQVPTRPFMHPPNPEKSLQHHLNLMKVVEAQLRRRGGDVSIIPLSILGLKVHQSTHEAEPQQQL